MGYGLFWYLLVFGIVSGLMSFFLRLNFVKVITKLKFSNSSSLLNLNLIFVFNLITIIFAYATNLEFQKQLLNYATSQTSFLNENAALLILKKNALFEFTTTMHYYFPFFYIFILITALSIFFCLSYNSGEIREFTTYCVIILIAGFGLFATKTFIGFFFFYECLLVPSFFILYKFAKTRRCVEAAYLMFFWTQFGALFLIFSFLYLFAITGSTAFQVSEIFAFSRFESNFLFACWFIGFGVKLPIWPFYGWLPKAHVEASTNFSIFLSGVLVKFAFFGLLKCLLTLKIEPTLIYVYPFLIVGLIDSVFKLFYQIDLKKLVAYSTVVEMHWLTFCIISGQSGLLLSGFCMLISHALMSTNSFLLVDALNRRFKTRLITEIGGVNFLCPKLFLAILVNLLIFLGFPGSLFFIAETLFFSFLFDLFPICGILFVFLLYFCAPIFFFRSWMNAMFGLTRTLSSAIPVDLLNKEIAVYFGISFLMFWLGITWQEFLF